MQRELLNQAPGAYRPAFGENIVERIDPLSCFQHFLTISFRLSHVGCLRMIVLNDCSEHSMIFNYEESCSTKVYGQTFTISNVNETELTVPPISNEMPSLRVAMLRVVLLVLI